MRDLLSITNQLFEANGSIEDLRQGIIDQVKKTKDQELLNRIYTVLNQSGLIDRISNTLTRDTDTRGYVDQITQIIIDTPGSYQEKYDFINGFPDGYVNIDLMLSGKRLKFTDLLTGGSFVVKIFDRLKRETFGTAKGPGEFALAVMSPHIKITGKGDLNIGDKVIEVKASAGKEVSSGGGRLGESGLLHYDDVSEIIQRNLEVDLSEVAPTGVGLGGLTELSSKLTTTERKKFGTELFNYIFKGTGADTSHLISAFTAGSDLRDAYIKANYEAYKHESEFEGIMIMNFALGELEYFRDVNDLVRHVYKGIGVYLVSSDPTKASRQILTQVTLAPFKEPPVVLPELPKDVTSKVKITKEFEDKMHGFAVDFAREQTITDPETIAKISDVAIEYMLADADSSNIMKKLKKKFPKGYSVSSAREKPSRPSKPIAEPSVVTGKRVEITPRGKRELEPFPKGIGRERR